ncbi:MAG: hypothetical protein A4E53_02896 [Pelotomaculum sp. PtaB.Bin104]|nr:MAG: hypothetical protein A4E53_02896 [Pelotomaculum sp. PtaB.Bin104]
MKILGKNGLGKLAVIFFIFGLFMCLGNTVLPTVADAAISVEVKGDGVTIPTTFTQAQLEAMTQVQAHYSTINTWPSKKWYVAEGVKLADLLTVAGIKPEAKLIKVISTDGYNLTFTKKELMDDPRYYFPGLKENAEYDGSVPGSPEGMIQVDTMLALKSAGSDNFDGMTSSNAPLLIMGQRWVTEQTNSAFVKDVGIIEVSTATPAKWENPAANPAGGDVAAGTKVALFTSDMDGDNIHYTTDGSDPTFRSPMYNWIKGRWWGSWPAEDLEAINHPIDVNDNMTIKAVAIGFGKTDSDIVAFNYQAPMVIDTDNPANATEGEAYAGHTFTAAGGVAPYSFAVTAGTLPAGMVLNGAVLEGTPSAAGTFTFTVTATDSAEPPETDSHEFTLVVEAGLAAPPVLAADATNNRVGQAIDITFTEDAAWRTAVIGVKVNDAPLSSGQYTFGEGNVNITADVFPAAGDYVIKVQAAGYSDAGVTQNIKAAASNPADFVVAYNTLVRYLGPGGDVIIPDDLGITGIASSYDVFMERTNLTSVSIPEGVTKVDNSNFYGCTNLTSVIIPGSVTSIGGSSFENCSRLSSITIPGSVTSIGINAFSGCRSLSSIVIPDGVTSIANNMFGGCSSLSSITIPGTVTSIGGSAFSGCSSLSSITIPGSVTSIGGNAFQNCTNLTSITIPGSVTSIGISLFRNCSSLSSVSIPEGLASIGNSMFSGCGSLASITIPGSVTSIGDNAFENCSSLASITIPGSVTSIGKNAFNGCGSLSSVSIPVNVASIGDSAFLNCSNLTAFDVSPDNLNYASDGGVLFNKAKTIIICYPAGKTGEYIVPEGVESIGNSAFRSCVNLTGVSIPGSVTSIGTYAFSGCGSLASIIIPSTVTSIGDNAFQNCSNLSSVSILEGVTSIGKSMFSGCSVLTSIIIPGTVTSIGDNAFQNCSNLSSVSILEGVTSIGNSMFSGCSGLTSIIIPGSVTSIGSSAFSGCTGLTAIVIPDSVTSIGGNAFQNCSSLSSIIIPSTVTSVGNYAFDGCSSLISIIIPNSVTSIGNYTFRNCSSMNSIIIPNSVTSIGTYAFDGCSGLSSIIIPNSVTSIGNYTFRNCSSLNSIIIPNSVTSIGTYAFDGCSGLSSIIIPNSVTSIGNYAFRNCSSLSSIIIPGSVTSIGSNTFSGCSNLTIYGYAGSYAASYAGSKSIRFVAITPVAALTLSGSPVLTYSGVSLTYDLGGLTLSGTDQSGAAIDLTGQTVTWAVYSGPATVTGSTLTITGSGTVSVTASVYGVTSNVLNLTVTSGSADPPVLNADTTGNTVGQAVELTFTDDATWRGAITGITVNGLPIDGQYTVADGKITINAGVFTTAGDYVVVVKATGYTDATVIQTINQIINAVYTITPTSDTAYQVGATPEGINTMTVNSDITGLKYFGVQVTPVREHSGLEAVVFTHQRNGAQLSINVTKADFDAVNNAQAGFNVQPGDVVKVFIVDDLTSAIDLNPVILQ